MTTSPAAEVRALTPATLADFMAFFDGDAFADNRRWGSCYCQFLYVDHDVVHWPGRTATENRAAVCDRVACATMQGYLAYRDGKPVGWCNAAPRKLIDAFASEPDPDDERLGVITCFVVALPHRRTGVARTLLEAACAGLAAQGMTIAEALPLITAQTDAENHYGPLELYLAAGFTVHRTDDEHIYVRRALP